MLLDTGGKVLSLMIERRPTARFQKARGYPIGTDGFSLLFQDSGGVSQEKIQVLVASHEPCTVSGTYMGRSYETHMYPVKDLNGEVTAVAVYSRGTCDRYTEGQGRTAGCVSAAFNKKRGGTSRSI